MADETDLKKTLAPMAQGQDPREAEFWQTNQNTDGSASRKDAVYRYTGNDVTPTFSVSAENDEIVRVVGHNFPEGVVATLQAVYGSGAGDSYTDVVVKGFPIELSAEQNILVVKLSGRYRFLFKDSWEAAADARIAIMRQERVAESYDGGTPEWVDTGVLQCRDGVLYRQQQNQFGRLRWITSNEDCSWVPTGELQCRGEEGLWQRERNIVGDYRWTLYAEDCGWVPTGEVQCRADHAIWQRERNAAGDYRWTQTTATCYDPTFPLPCKGWAFGPGDVVDPAAIVEFENCNGEGLGYFIYAEPAPGHTIPVYKCGDMDCPVPENIIGYAANMTRTGVRDICDDATRTKYACATTTAN